MAQGLWIKMANLVFELEKKTAVHQPAATAAGAASTAASAATTATTAAATTSIKRNIDRMKAVLEEAGLVLLNPIGETYNETRTDLEASIIGHASGSLKVLEVIKPVVYTNQEGRLSLLQKGVVIVGNK